jgi:uncharacterized protein (TIGR00303 family)
MSFKVPKDILICHEEVKGKAFVEKAWGKRPTFVCVIANTETAKIPGISAAGAVPAITDFTPAADIELLYYGRCKCIDGVPVTPNGIPTPALVTMSAIGLTGMPFLAANGGVRVKPHAPYFELEGYPGEDIKTGAAVRDPRRVFENAVIAGEELAKTSDYLVVGESIAGGTTTALAVLLALGYNADGKVSSTLPENPHTLKSAIAKEGISKSRSTPEQMKKDAMLAIAAVGDPMMPAAAGLIVGAARHLPVLLAGGTQMAAVLAVVKSMESSVLNNVALGTTRWIINDPTADLVGIVGQIGPVPVLAANLDFTPTKHEGLTFYEKGLVKEGVGAGGVSIAAICQSSGAITCDILFAEIEKNYEKIMKLAKH